MKKTLRLSFVCFLLLVTSLLVATTSFAAADESQNQKDIVEAKQYIKKNIPLLKEEFASLDNKATLEQVEKVIEDFYVKNPAPEAFNNPNIDIVDVFPHLKEKKKNKTLNLNDFVKEKKLAKDKSVFTFKSGDSSVEVVISETGDIVILEGKSVPSEDITAESNNGDIGVLAYPSRYTAIDTNTGIAYNAYGGKMFSLWAKGQFKYNGSTVSATLSEGSYEKHFWGSTLSLSSRGLGSTRNYNISGYNYSEVYTRLYYEASFPVKWAGVVMTSDTVEVYVGSTVNGSRYGGIVRR